MANKIEYSRLVLKRATQTGVTPTINTISPDVIDENWLATDILTGELFLNTADDKLFIRTDNGITEITTGTVSGATGIYLPLAGGTMSGDFTAKSIEIDSGSSIKSTNGGGQIDLDSGGVADKVSISTDGGVLAESRLVLDNTSGSLVYGVSNGLIVNNTDAQLAALNTNGSVSLFADKSINIGYASFTNANITIESDDFVKIDTPDFLVGSNNRDAIKCVDNTSSSVTSDTQDVEYGITIGSKNSTVNSGVVNSVILGGEGLTASEDNTAYMQKADIEDYIDLKPQSTFPTAKEGRMFYSAGTGLFVCNGNTAGDWVQIS